MSKPDLIPLTLYVEAGALRALFEGERPARAPRAANANERWPPDPATFEGRFAADLVASGIVAPDRWGRRNATQIAKGVSRAGVQSYDALRAASFARVAAKARLAGVKGRALESAIVRLKAHGEAEPVTALRSA